MSNKKHKSILGERINDIEIKPRDAELKAVIHEIANFLEERKITINEFELMKSKLDEMFRNAAFITHYETPTTFDEATELTKLKYPRTRLK